MPSGYPLLTESFFGAAGFHVVHGRLQKDSEQRGYLPTSNEMLNYTLQRIRMSRNSLALPFLLLLMLLAGCSPSPRKLQLFADDYVKERQEKWKDRAAQVSIISKGTTEADVLKQLGKPDVTSDSATAKN